MSLTILEKLEDACIHLDQKLYANIKTKTPIYSSFIFYKYNS